jgi:isochorismate hydrolase
VLLCGLEGHVCVLQTTMDLLSQDVSVHIVCDAISSQRPYDRSCAINRAIAMGAVPTTTESAIFELMGSAEYEHFKTISGLIKNHNDVVKVECPVDFE